MPAVSLLSQFTVILACARQILTADFAGKAIQARITANLKAGTA